MFAFFLSSGLFLGWSLGANDASNVFGTAVGTRMIRFRTAALICSLFVIVGAVVSGAGASHTLGKLGAVNALAGAFIVTFSAGLSVYLMTLARYPVSTSQAIVGAIIGWNFFSGSITDASSLTKIVMTWVLCPVLSAVIAVCLYKIVAFVIAHARLHMFRLDTWTRYGLVLAGAFGSYALGANNIANVMGVFVPVAPFPRLSLFGGLSLSPAQQLFLIGGIAIAVGVSTYSKKVMLTVGEGIVDLSPVSAFVVVCAHSIVLFLFASKNLELFLKSYGLPTIPLVPVSSSQAIVGAVIGIGLLKGGRGIRWRTVAGIASGWVTTPIIAGLVSLIALYFMQNVFQQPTYKPVHFRISGAVIQQLAKNQMDTQALMPFEGKLFDDAISLKKAIGLKSPEIERVLDTARIEPTEINSQKLNAVDRERLTPQQWQALQSLSGMLFSHRWQLAQALAGRSEQWRPESCPEPYQITDQLDYLYRIFRTR